MICTIYSFRLNSYKEPSQRMQLQLTMNCCSLRLLTLSPSYFILLDKHGSWGVLCTEASLFFKYLEKSTMSLCFLYNFLVRFHWITNSLCIPEFALFHVQFMCIQFLIMSLRHQWYFYLLVIVFQVMTVIVTK